LLDLFIEKHYVGNHPSEALEKEKKKVNICAGGILCKENKILLGKRSAHRSFYPDVWDIIGGHRENNETPDMRYCNWILLFQDMQRSLGA
jgi:hypothetical protein